MRTIAGLVLFLCLPGLSLAQDAAVPRNRADAARLAVSNYGDCSKAQLYLLSITPGECARRVELARTECESIIQSGLPAQLDDKGSYKLGNRSIACLKTYRDGTPYSNDSFDPLIDKGWEVVRRAAGG